MPELIPVGSVVCIADAVRPDRFAGRQGTVVGERGDELGVDLDGDDRADAWFRPDELTPVDAHERRYKAPHGPAIAERGDSYPIAHAPTFSTASRTPDVASATGSA